jgi:hypothetical protein
MSDNSILLNITEYKNILHDISKNNKVNLNLKEYNYQINELKLRIFKKIDEQPQFNAFDDFNKYISLIISKSLYVFNIYDIFANIVSKKMNKYDIPVKDYIIYAKGGLILRDKIDEFIKSKYIKNREIVNLMKNIICNDKYNCINPILNESDFDVNCIILNDKNREKIKNIVASILIDIKNKIDKNEDFNNWIMFLNNLIYRNILKELFKKYNNKNRQTKKESITFGNKINKFFPNLKHKKNKTKKTKKNNKYSESSYTLSGDKSYKIKPFEINSTISIESLTADVLKNKNFRLADYKTIIKELNNLDQNRYSFYINNLKDQDYTVYADINNFNNLNDFFKDKELKYSQVFVSMNENIQNKLIKDETFKRNIHFDLYRLKLNFTFLMKYSNVFKKNFGGEIIDISFPYKDNAYFLNQYNDYDDKIMISKKYKGIFEFNMWGILNDLVETIEIESINISKPNKFEKRIQRFIFIRFIEYWIRMPFRNNKELNFKTYFMYNLQIEKYGDTFSDFFKKAIYKDYEFIRIKDCLMKNQKINIYTMFHNFLQNEPYKTLFNMSRKNLDKALNITEEEIISMDKIIFNHKDLYSIFFDLKN